VFASTVAVYGRDFDLHADESTPVAPRTPYARSKLAGEAAVRERHGVVLRLPLTYGPGDRGNMAQLIGAVASGRFVLPGPCDQPRSFLAADNAAHAVACVLAIPQPPEDDLFLLTDEDDRSTSGVVAVIVAALTALGRPAPPVRRAPYALVWAAGLAGSAAGVLGIRVPVTLAALRKLTTGLTFSCARARAQLGYAPVRRFADAMHEAVAAPGGRPGG
jgi:nucleoside-diphosphate-sugar epimerase